MPSTKTDRQYSYLRDITRLCNANIEPTKRVYSEYSGNRLRSFLIEVDCIITNENYYCAHVNFTSVNKVVPRSSTFRRYQNLNALFSLKERQQ